MGQLRLALPGAQVLWIKDQGNSRREVADRFEGFASLVTAVVIVFEGLVMLTSMMASVNGRTREIGVLSAMGFRSFHILGIVLMEAIIVSFLAGIMGYGLGMATAAVAGPILAGLAGIYFSPGLLALVVLLAITTGALGGLYPALRAARLEPHVALRSI